MAAQSTANWGEIKTLYEQGTQSNRELARRYAPLTEGTIRKRAKKEVWARPDRARIARRGPAVRRAGRQDPNPWRHWEAAASRIIVDHRDRTDPVGSSPEDILEVAEAALAMLLSDYANIIKNRKSLIHKLEHCAEEHHVTDREYLKFRKYFEPPALGRQLRDMAETFKVLTYIR